MTSSPDILIIGGGVTGLTTALCLAQEGVSVSVLDRQRPGQEASWAGAGMLPPGVLSRARNAEGRLRAYSHTLWAELSENLRSQTGIDNGYRVCGSVELPDAAGFEASINAWQAEGIKVERCSRAALEVHVPDLNAHFQSGVYLPEFGQARNPRHLKALIAACHSLGVEIVEGVNQLKLIEDGECVLVSSPGRAFPAEKICVTAGAWTSELLNQVRLKLPVYPVRGQMAQLRVPRLPFSCVIEQGRRYVVPRADGLILIGSTEEHTGFDQQTTAEGISGLLDFARTLVPELGRAELVRSWAGLRPGSPDELPFLGKVPFFSNLYVGAGHFRSGLQMSPGTGRVLSDLLLDRCPAIDLEGLSVERVLPGGNPLSA